MNENFFYGCLPAKKDLRDYKIHASANIVETFPEIFELPRYGKVKNQGTVSSCVPHAISTVLEYFDKGYNVLSTNFIYGLQERISGRLGKGMYLTDACKIVQQYGDMLYTDCCGNSESPDCKAIAEKALADETKAETAYNYRINSYYSCPTYKDIKHALINYGMVLGAIKMYQKYTIDENGIIHMDQTSDYGLHCVVIYGWNKDGFLIQNSWGKLWGHGGCAVIPYNDKLIVEAKALIDYENPDDEALVRPKNNSILNILYKIVNFILQVYKDWQNNKTS